MNETVNNVYVDWGDGTVEPLTVQWQGQECGNNPCFVSNTETSSASLFGLDQATNRGAFLHPYSQVGSYDVRVYVLPGSNAAQQGALPASIHAGAGGLYGKLLKRVGQGSAGGSAEDALAYMLFCQTVHIQPRTDPATNGKLQLKSISVVGFPDAPASGSARAVRAGAGAQAMTSKPIAKLPAASPSPTAAKTLTAEEGGAAGLARGLSPGGAAGGPPLPQFSSCDANLVGGATLKFVGEGTAHLTWYEDGQAVGSSDEPIGPSLPRTQQQLAPPPPPSFTGPGLHLVPVVEPVPPVVTDWPGLQSPDLSLAQMGKHELMVTAEVETDLHPTGRVLDALGELAGNSPRDARRTGRRRWQGRRPGCGESERVRERGPRRGTAARASGTEGRGRLRSAAHRLGRSGPRGSARHEPHLSLGARGAMLNGGLQGNPPDAVVSAPVAYQVTAANPTEPCTFNFPVQGGDKFVIAGLQHGRQGERAATGRQLLRHRRAASTVCGGERHRHPGRPRDDPVPGLDHAGRWRDGRPGHVRRDSARQGEDRPGNQHDAGQIRGHRRGPGDRNPRRLAQQHRHSAGKRGRNARVEGRQGHADSQRGLDLRRAADPAAPGLRQRLSAHCPERHARFEPVAGSGRQHGLLHRPGGS